MKNKVDKIRKKKKELVLFDRERRGGNFFARARHFALEPTKNQSLWTGEKTSVKSCLPNYQIAPI